ncbi:MAG: methyltransferase, partial [Pseudomonadota bacterium]
MKLALSALTATSIFVLAACTAPADVEDTATTDVETAVTETEEVVAETVDAAPAMLDAILAAQPEETQARYGARNPAETLAFFGIEPGMTVAEALPGGGWYSKILIPYVGAEGELVGAHYPDVMWSVIFPDGDAERIQGVIDRANGWADGTAEWGIENGAKVSQFKMTTADDEIDGKLDAFLFIRAMHNLHRAEAESGIFTETVAETYDLLKPGGVVGVVQHRAPESNSDDWADGNAGYLKQSRVVAAFEAVGFVLEATSEVNANPDDQPTEDDVVWRLPPVAAGT